MEEQHLQAKLYVLKDILEAEESYRPLILSSRDAAKSSYSPYSHFRVGAAILLEDGTIVQGSNQENIASSSGLCAERVAIFAAAAQYPGKKILAVAIHSPDYSDPGHPMSPCGSCRQVMYEYEWKQKSPVKLFLSGSKPVIWHLESVKAILPVPFLF